MSGLATTRHKLQEGVGLDLELCLVCRYQPRIILRQIGERWPICRHLTPSDKCCEVRERSRDLFGRCRGPY
jgi:hypothetical protein